jgi:hypothetical protein
MNEEARQRIDELQKERRGGIFRNALLIVTSASTVVMAFVLWVFLNEKDRDVNVYVQEAQRTVRVACQAAEGEPLPAEVQQACNAAERNELPSVLQSVVDNPDPDDPEIQESERQDPEAQDPEIQDPEGQESEVPDSETNDPDPDDPETQEDEIQEGEIQEPEIQDPEEQGAPICSPGYSRQEFHWYGRDGVDNTGDEQDWEICVKD